MHTVKIVRGISTVRLAVGDVGSCEEKRTGLRISDIAARRFVLRAFLRSKRCCSSWSPLRGGVIDRSPKCEQTCVSCMGNSLPLSLTTMVGRSVIAYLPLCSLASDDSNDGSKSFHILPRD